MLINTPVDVGYEFWVARAREEYSDLEFTDDDGNRWTRKEKTWVPYVRHKRVTAIEISVGEDKKTRIKFLAVETKPFAWQCNAGSDQFLPMASLYSFMEIQLYKSEEEAMQAARKLALNKIPRINYDRLEMELNNA